MHLRKMKYLPSMRSFLQQPYPFSDNASRRLVFCLGIGIFIAFFLAVFAPFGFDELPTVVKWGHASLFGAVTFVVSSFLQVLLPIIFPTAFLETTWRSWKEIVFLLVTTLFIGAGNYLLMLYLYPQNTELSGLLRAEIITLQVGIFPICFVVFMKQMTMYRRFSADAKEATADIQEENLSPVLPEPAMQKVQLRGDNQKEELIISPNNLFFVSSADNYVRLQFTEAGVQKSILLRSTLKKMEEQLADQPAFFRCHRMYLVNLQLVASVSGNAQGLKLHLHGVEEAIPVSRSLTETVKQKLHQLSHSPQNI